MNSQSPNYHYLCWYKIVEDINVKREEETTKFKGRPCVEIPRTSRGIKIEQRKRLEETYSFIKAGGADDAAWDDLVPDEVLSWKFNPASAQIGTTPKPDRAHDKRAVGTFISFAWFTREP